ncbi:MAG: transglycosylase domain-containing protein [Minisyncoccales bacterium]
MKQKIKKLLKLVSFFFFFFLFLLVFFLFLFFKDFPRPEEFQERELAQSTKIFDRNGLLLHEIFDEEKRTYVSLDKIPDHLKKAVISIEDKNFYQHQGVDFKGILRAILLDLKLKKLTFGGSTIPQQLIRSTFLFPEKTFARKTKEVVLAIQLTKKYSKDQILEWYLNQIPFGPNIYGVQSAAQSYFGKNVWELNLAQSAILVSLIKAPSLLSPWGNEREKLLERKNLVIDEMLKENFISLKEANEAKNEKIVFLPPPKIKAPHFVLMINSLLEKEYSREYLITKGLKVYTTLDLNLQEIAEKIIKEKGEKNKKYNAYNVAMVVIKNQTGEILVWVGSRNFFGEKEPKDCLPGKNCKFDPQFDILRSKIGRQPGSAFKPFVYATAFKNGFDDKTKVIDEPTCFGIWGGKEYCPYNYDLKFRGSVSLREALAQSLNVPSVKVLIELAGLENSIQTAREMGITTLKEPFGPAIVLGGWEVNLLEITSAYSVFANEGLKKEINFFQKIEDLQGNVLKELKINEKRVLSQKVSNLISDILSDNNARAPIFGYYSDLYFPSEKVSVKTGTTNDFRDAWTIGYTKEITIGVWVGNNDNSPMKNAPGISVAAPIFREFLNQYLKIKKS